MALTLTTMSDSELQAVIDSQGSQGKQPVYAPALREVLNAAGDGACAMSVPFSEIGSAKKRANVLTGLRKAVKDSEGKFDRITVLSGTDDVTVVFQVAAVQ